jgi:hypothetical protein
MSTAKVLGQVPLPQIDPNLLEQLRKKAKFDGIAAKPATREIVKLLGDLFPDAYDIGLYSTLGVSPHTDDAAVGEITLGVVIEGNHYLFVEDDEQEVGELVPGTVFALQNKKIHGAYARDKENPTPLVFVACDPNLMAKNWRSFCNKIGKAITQLTINN